MSDAKLALEQSTIMGNELVAPDVYLMTLSAPHCASCAMPGQFIELRVPGDKTELLRLPFSLYGFNASAGTIEVLYQVLGRGTERMAALQAGSSCDLIGSIGHGWNPPSSVGRALLVSGGLGAAPLTPLAQLLAGRGVRVDVCMGAPTAQRLVCRDRLAACAHVQVATDDGGEGLHGFCTELSSKRMDDNAYDYVATCGPQPMQAIVASQASKHGFPCEVSLERLMACGIGACLSCVVETRGGLKRACVDGPVFDAREVVW